MNKPHEHDKTCWLCRFSNYEREVIATQAYLIDTNRVCDSCWEDMKDTLQPVPTEDNIGGEN